MNKQMLMHALANALTSSLKPAERVEMLSEGIADLAKAIQEKNWPRVNGIADSLVALLPPHIAEKIRHESNAGFANTFHKVISELNTEANWRDGFPSVEQPPSDPTVPDEEVCTVCNVAHN